MWCIQIFKPSELCNEHCKFLAALCKRALMVPFVTSINVKYLASLTAVSAIASVGIGDWYYSHKKQSDSTWTDLYMHILILSVSFWGITTIGTHHSVASVMGAMIPCSCNNSSSAFNMSLYAKGTVWGAFTQKGTALSVSVMWNYSLSISLTWLSDTNGNSSPGLWVLLPFLHQSLL